MKLDNADTAVKAAARLLTAARKANAKVVHIVNDGGEGAPYDIRSEIGASIAEVAPIEGEPVVVKTFGERLPRRRIGEDAARDRRRSGGGDRRLHDPRTARRSPQKPCKLRRSRRSQTCSE